MLQLNNYYNTIIFAFTVIGFTGLITKSYNNILFWVPKGYVAINTLNGIIRNNIYTYGFGTMLPIYSLIYINTNDKILNINYHTKTKDNHKICISCEVVYNLEIYNLYLDTVDSVKTKYEKYVRSYVEQNIDKVFFQYDLSQLYDYNTRQHIRICLETNIYNYIKQYNCCLKHFIINVAQCTIKFDKEPLDKNMTIEEKRMKVLDNALNELSNMT